MSGIKGWVGVDLDGTLALYDHWRGIEHIGQPIDRMVRRVKDFLRDGREVRIFTARVADPETEVLVRQIITDWLIANGLPPLAVTNVKDFQMVELWDDRAVQVIPNTGRRADGHG